MRYRAAIVLLLLLLSGCTQEPFGETYSKRLAVFMTVPTPLKEEVYAGYPPRKARLFAIPSISVSLLEFLKMQSCEVGSVVGERNSSLGKLYSASQRLSYELRLVAGLKDCQPKSPRLKKKLAGILEAKRRHLPRVRWNAGLGSKEMADYFSVASQFMVPHELKKVPWENHVQALEAYRLWLRQSPSIEVASGNRFFQVLDGTRLGGRLIQTGVRLSGLLGNTVQTLSRLDPPSAKQCLALRHAFEAEYVKKIQPWLSLFVSRSRHWVEQIRELGKAAGTPPSPQMTRFTKRYLTPGSFWRDFTERVRAHSKQWSRVSRQCGFEPGKKY